MKDSEADIAIGVLNKLIDQELEAVGRRDKVWQYPLRRLRPDPTTTPTSTPGTRSGRRSPQPWMKGMRESVPAAA